MSARTIRIRFGNNMHRIVALILALMPWSVALAGDLRGDDSAAMMVEGTISGVKRGGDAIVVADRLYYTGPRTHVERQDGRVGSTRDLAAGQLVGFNFRVDERQRLVLTTVRILRPDAGLEGQVGGQGGKLSR